MLKHGCWIHHFDHAARSGNGRLPPRHIHGWSKLGPPLDVPRFTKAFEQKFREMQVGMLRNRLWVSVIRMVNVR